MSDRISTRDAMRVEPPGASRCTEIRLPNIDVRGLLLSRSFV